MITISNLNMKFGKMQVLNDIDVELPKGECIALIGPNGCGKTTLIKSILGMVMPNSGSIKINGKEIKENYLYRSYIGYMPQIGRYPDHMTIGQLIRMLKDIRQKNKEQLDEELLYKFDLASIFHKKMRTLSGGMTQKVSATIAFLFNPEILILDEPTAGLDPLASEILKEKIIDAQKKGKLILITSHLLSELDEMISQLIYMQDGNIIFQKNILDLQKETGEEKISNAITAILKHN